MAKENAAVSSGGGSLKYESEKITDYNGHNKLDKTEHGTVSLTRTLQTKSSEKRLHNRLW